MDLVFHAVFDDSEMDIYMTGKSPEEGISEAVHMMVRHMTRNDEHEGRLYPRCPLGLNSLVQPKILNTPLASISLEVDKVPTLGGMLVNP